MTDQPTTGYCPACGRGDLAPTADAWEQQRQRAETAEAKVADYENRITWDTTCGSCARILDSSIRETERRERAEATLREVLDAFEAYWARASYCGPGQSTVQPEHFQAWRATLKQSSAATEATEHTCTDTCRGITGIRGLLEHVGIDTRGKDIRVDGRLVDPAHDAGPTTAECAAADRAHWTNKYAGEGE